MATKITTTQEGILVGGSGTFRITDTNPHEGLKVLSIWVEADATFTKLTHVDPNGTETNAINTRTLGNMAASGLYSAGINSYFKEITLSAGTISCNSL